MSEPRRSQIDIGAPPHPTDRERELSLAISRELSEATSHADRVTALTRALARYRIELEARDSREAAHAIVEQELRDQRIATVFLREGGITTLERGTGETVDRFVSYSLLGAADMIGKCTEAA